MTTNAEGIGQPGRLKGSTTSYDILCLQTEIEQRLALPGETSGPHNTKVRVPLDRATYAGRFQLGTSDAWTHVCLVQEDG